MGALGVLIGAACGGTIEGATSMGEPCTPSVQSQPGFTGFDPKEVTLETGAKACPSGICLVNHFQGRVGSPYGGPGSTYGGPDFPPQCLDRKAKDTVFCSCRCANGAGRTDDGSVYCTCDPGFECTHLVSSIGPSTDAVAGSYCTITNTTYDRPTACSTLCDATTAPCP